MATASVRVDGVALAGVPERIGYVHVSLPAEHAGADPYGLYRCEYCRSPLIGDAQTGYVADGNLHCEKDPTVADDPTRVGLHSAEPVPLAWAKNAVVDLLDDEDAITLAVELADLPGSITLTLWRDGDGLEMRLEAPPDDLHAGELVIEPASTLAHFRVWVR